MNAIKLTQHGIERLFAMSNDIRSGNFEAEACGSYSDGKTMYYSVSIGAAYATCAFVSQQDDVADDVLNQIDISLSSKLKLFTSSTSGNPQRYRLIGYSKGSGIPLERKDYSTPAQRALESLGKRLAQQSAEVCA